MTVVLNTIKSLKVGLLGFGTVGKGIFDIIENKKDVWRNEFGYEITIVAIVVEDPSKHESISHLLVPLGKFLDVVSVDLIIEAIGGNIVLEILLEALRNGIDVITANKEVISSNFDRLRLTAKNYDAKLMYEACVGSSIPIIKTLQEQILVQDIESISGILNGTCNFILNKMEQNLSFEKALKIAQEHGYAEVDPSIDVDGIDSAYKLSILASICRQTQTNLEEVEIKGIREISTTEITEAKSNNFRIKLVATYNPTFSPPLSVKPQKIDSTHPFYNVEGEENVIIISGSYTGDITLKGKGAGRYPAASAISFDLLNYIRSETLVGYEHV